MYEPLALHLPEFPVFSANRQNFLGTQNELLQSDYLRQRALAQLAAGSGIPKGKNGQPGEVTVRLSQAPPSSVFLLEASGTQPAYTQAYLNALMMVYLNYKKNIHLEISGESLAAVSEHLQRAERELKDAQDSLTAYETTNCVTILQEERTIGGNYLARLQIQISDLEIENELLRVRASDSASTGADTTNPSLASPKADNPLATVPAQSVLTKEQAALALRKSNALRVSKIQAAIKEWETRLAWANSRIANAEALRRGVERRKKDYDRLVTLFSNIHLSRNLDQEPLTILEQASPARRSYVREQRLLVSAGLGGLGLGCGILALGGRRDRRKAAKAAIRVPSEPAARPDAVERLKQVKSLYEQNLLSREAYDQKVREILDSL